jgi:DNA-binding MarR family transcriptional regulator
MIIGPRGIGKTNLLRMIEHRIRNTPELARKWQTSTFAEENYSITRTADLLLEACTPTELAAEARIPAKTVRALLTRLERAGYLRREQRQRKYVAVPLPPWVI